MTKLRVMPLFVEDVLSDATMTLLSATAFGAAWRLFFRAWLEDGVPNSQDALRRLTGVDGRSWPRIWAEIESLFAVGDDGRLHSLRQESIRSRTLEKVAKARNAAKIGVVKRANAERTLSNTEHGTKEHREQDPSDLGGHPPTPPEQTDLPFEISNTDDPTDMQGQEAVWAVFYHWRSTYPEHGNADLSGPRPAMIKRAIANRRKALRCNRRLAVDAVKRAMDQASRDDWLAGRQKDGRVKTELSALLQIEAFERLCRLSDGTEPDHTPVVATPTETFRERDARLISEHESKRPELIPGPTNHDEIEALRAAARASAEKA